MHYIENIRRRLYSGELPAYQLMELFVRTVVNEYHLKEYENE